MSLKKLLQKRNSDLLVTPRLDAWLLSVKGQLELDPDIAAMVVEKVTGSQQNRSGRFHPSASGKCPRRQQFSFYGLSERSPTDSVTMMKFLVGTWGHLRWQVMLIQSGIAQGVEVPVEHSTLPVAGNMDALGVDSKGRFGIEIKTWRSLPKEPKDYHVRQIHAYMALADLDRFSLLYEDKASSDWREFVIKRDEALIEEIEREWEMLTEASGEDESTMQLIKPLSECYDGRGDEWKWCPYRDRCLDIE